MYQLIFIIFNSDTYSVYYMFQAAERFLDPSLKAKLYMTLNKLVILEESQVNSILFT